MGGGEDNTLYIFSLIPAVALFRPNSPGRWIIILEQAPSFK